MNISARLREVELRMTKKIQSDKQLVSPYNITPKSNV